MIVPGCLNGFTDDEVGLLTRISLLSGRPVNWNVLAVTAVQHRRHRAPAGGVDRGRRRPGPGSWRSRCPTPCPCGSPSSTAPSSTACRGGGSCSPADPERIERCPTLRCGGHGRAGQVRRGRRCCAIWPVWAHLIIDETFAPEQQSAGGRTVGDVAAERGMDPLDALARHRGGRQAAHRVRLPIGESEADWALRAKVWQRPACGGGRVRRRGPPGHHVRGGLLHLTCSATGCGSVDCCPAGGGGPPAHRRPRPPLRTHRPGPSGRGVVGRHGGLRSRADRAGPDAHPRRSARRGQSPVRRGHRHRARPGQRHRDGPATASSPGPCPGGSCARAPTPGRRPSSTAAADGPPADRVGTPEKICRSCRSGRGPFDIPVRGRDRPCPPNRGVSHAALPQHDPHRRTEPTGRGPEPRAPGPDGRPVRGDHQGRSDARTPPASRRPPRAPGSPGRAARSAIPTGPSPRPRRSSAATPSSKPRTRPRRSNGPSGSSSATTTSGR